MTIIENIYQMKNSGVVIENNNQKTGNKGQSPTDGTVFHQEITVCRMLICKVKARKFCRRGFTTRIMICKELTNSSFATNLRNRNAYLHIKAGVLKECIFEEIPKIDTISNVSENNSPMLLFQRITADLFRKTTQFGFQGLLVKGG